MRRTVTVMILVSTFTLGAAIGSFAAKKGGVTSAAWQGVSAAEAAANLLALGRDFAGNDSWENINLARVHYLSGDKAQAEPIFERFGGAKAEAGDLIRIARVYAHAGEWDKARPLFDKVLELAPKDEDWLIEVGAFYNLNGDREHAEELFARGFGLERKSLYNTLTAAGSYLGVLPRRR